MGFVLRLVLATIAFLLPAAGSIAGDWPAFRHDAERSGFTRDSLPESLALQWVHADAHPPRPAWPRSNRMTFDRAAAPISAGGRVFFGSSIDGSIHALDAATGERRWTFPTRGPIRFAPAVLDGRVYATSDDGFLYCLDAADGSLLWKKRGGPGEESILGNGRMISRWPARGGVVIRDGIVYFAAGIWPSDGVSLFALDPATGRVLWVNDTAGSIYMGQPHGGAFAKSGVAAQGYLVASKDRIFMATGRGVPASFDRQTGEFQYLDLQGNTHRGGAEVVLSDRFLLNQGYAFVQESGALQGKVGPGPAIVTDAGLVVMANGKSLLGRRWADKETIDRKGQPQPGRHLETAFEIPFGETAFSAIGADDSIVLGLENAVVIRSLDPKKEAVRRFDVDGTVYGLAAADGRLFVSTDEGRFYCFGAGERKPKAQPAGSKITNAIKRENGWETETGEILERSGIEKGYCLDFGCGDGRLAIELARRSGEDLFIYGIDPDPENIAAAREQAIAAGIYGARVMFLEADLADSELPDYFANLIVSTRALGGETLTAGALAEARRLLRPWGGALIAEKTESGALKIERRGALEGAGQWTHQYANPANSVNSGDELIRGPLGMLWFNDLEQAMTQRHGRAPAPLFSNGVIFSEGLNSIIAVDAYNGTLLWEYELPGILTAYDGDHLMGTSGTGSNYCVSDEAVFVRRGDHCLRIDAKSGERLATFKAPKPAGGGETVWGYLAHEDGILFGTLADPEHVPTFRYRPGGDMNEQLTESRAFFALDAETGDLLWRYDAEHSLRHNAIAIGNRAVVLIDRAQALFDRKTDTKADPEAHPAGKLIALHAETGEELWRNDDDIYGTLAAISEEHHTVLMAYQPTRFRLASEIGGRLAVFDLSTGKRKWESRKRYDSRPLLNGDTIYAQGGAWDLLTGEERPFNFKRSYGCGILAGSRDLMVFRSATLGYFDLTKNQATEDYGGIRPGCWINAIPAGGLVLVPDASAGCKCSYLNQSWIALRPNSN